MMARIGILTGTFDPVHEGHVAVARVVRQQCGLESVWFWPNARPAHKVPVADLGARLAMLQLALSDEAFLEVAPLEVNDFDQPHTLEYFTEVLARFGGQEFVFIVGEDTLSGLDTWRDVESVVNNTSYIMVQRPGAPTHSLTDLRQRLGDLGTSLRVEVVQAPLVYNVSSTAIRQSLSCSRQPAGLHPLVAQYARSVGFYS